MLPVTKCFLQNMSDYFQQVAAESRLMRESEVGGRRAQDSVLDLGVGGHGQVSLRRTRANVRIIHSQSES